MFFMEGIDKVSMISVGMGPLVRKPPDNKQAQATSCPKCGCKWGYRDQDDDVIKCGCCDRELK